MGINKLKPTTPGSRFRSNSTFEEVTKTTPEKSLTAAIKRSGEEIIMDALQQDILAVDIKEDIELSILKEINLVYLQRFFRLNMILTELAELLCCIMLMEKKDIF